MVIPFFSIRSRMFRLIVAGHQQAAQQFSDRGLRKRIDKDETPRTLEIGKPRRATKLIELGFADRGLALDKGGDDLAPLLVGKTDDGDLPPRGRQRKADFNLKRERICTPG